MNTPALKRLNSSAGATVFLQKPYALEDLLRTVFDLIHEAAGKLQLI